MRKTDFCRVPWARELFFTWSFLIEVYQTPEAKTLHFQNNTPRQASDLEDRQQGRGAPRRVPEQRRSHVRVSSRPSRDRVRQIHRYQPLQVDCVELLLFLGLGMLKKRSTMMPALKRSGCRFKHSPLPFNFAYLLIEYSDSSWNY